MTRRAYHPYTRLPPGFSLTITGGILNLWWGIELSVIKPNSVPALGWLDDFAWAPIVVFGAVAVLMLYGLWRPDSKIRVAGLIGNAALWTFVTAQFMASTTTKLVPSLTLAIVWASIFRLFEIGVERGVTEDGD